MGILNLMSFHLLIPYTLITGKVFSLSSLNFLSCRLSQIIPVFLVVNTKKHWPTSCTQQPLHQRKLTDTQCSSSPKNHSYPGQKAIPPCAWDSPMPLHTHCASEHGIAVSRVSNGLVSIPHIVQPRTAYCRKGCCKISSSYYSASVGTCIWLKPAAMLFPTSFSPNLLRHLTSNNTRQNSSLSLGWMQMPLAEQLTEVLMIFLTKQKLRVPTSVAFEMHSHVTTCEWK